MSLNRERNIWSTVKKRKQSKTVPNKCRWILMREVNNWWWTFSVEEAPLWIILARSFGLKLKYLKGIVHPKMKILSVRTHSHACVVYVHIKAHVSHASWYSPKRWNMWFGGELLNKVIIFVFFALKKYSCSFVKLRLNHICHTDCFTDVLITFLGLGTFQLHCCLWRVRELSDLIKNILIWILKMNEGLMGLERHEGE